MGMEFTIIHLMISILLFFVLFFGIGFILNMLLRMTWVMACVYPIIVLFIVDNLSLIDYVQNPGLSFQTLGTSIVSLAPADFTILLSGFLGSICSGLTMKALRKRGYQMF
jgi:purine-cytosine permease-like protein